MICPLSKAAATLEVDNLRIDKRRGSGAHHEIAGCALEDDGHRPSLGFALEEERSHCVMLARALCFRLNIGSPTVVDVDRTSGAVARSGKSWRL